MRVRRATPLSAIMLAAVSSLALAQIRASERGTVSQTVDGTVITVNYGRAQVRGRDSLFGKVIPPEEIWTMGANQSSTLEVSRDVRIGGRTLPAGKYSMWMTRPGEWKLHLHKDATLFHTNPPKLSDMLLSIPVTPANGEPVEVLTFDFPRVWAAGTELRFRWGTAVVPIEILVQPSYPSVVMTAEQLAPYLGSYSVTFQGATGKTPPMRLEIVNAKGTLRGILDDPTEPMEMEFLATRTPHRFMPGFLQHGKLFDVETLPVLFEVVNGRAVGFRVGEGKQLWMEGRRR
jgi:hypothetical protein